MAKFHGDIGFVETREDPPESSKYKEFDTRRPYSGELVRNTRGVQPGGNLVNDNVTISNQISIIADEFANDNLYSIRYVVFHGKKWKITNVDVQRPRFIITIGGLYHGG